MKRVRQKCYDFMRENLISIPVEFSEIQRVAIRNKWLLIDYDEAPEIMRHLKLPPDFNFEIEMAARKGFTIFQGNELVIFCNNKLSYEERIITILHEFGHIYLHHSCCGILGRDINERTTKIQEEEAEAFAIEVMAPLPILKKCGVTKAEDIENMGLISGANAKTQFSDMKSILNEIPEPHEIYNDFISEYRSKKKNRIKKKLFPFVVAGIIGICILTGFVGFRYITNARAVYITDTGTKYHEKDCSYIDGKDVTKTTKGQAEKEGLNPCTQCKP